MVNVRFGHFVLVVCCLFSGLEAQTATRKNPGCENQTPRQCLELALNAMGGRERLQQINNERLQTIGHTLLMEQSYRQEPFITSYETATTTLDFANQQFLKGATLTWPESDPNQSELKSTTVAGREGGVTRTKDGDRPCGLVCVNEAREQLALGPARLLLTASEAQDLQFSKPQILRSTPHTVLAFMWNKVPVRILVNEFNHLPDAVETTQEFHDFWYFWGDVRQRTYFDNWQIFQGISYPTNLVQERNGSVWRSTQALKVEFNVAVEPSAFHMDAAMAQRSLASKGWGGRAFSADKDITLAPGIDLFPGAWNSTIVKLSDGVAILEAPISGLYTQGIVDEAKKRYPRARIEAVLSTSDSWPHTGGVRFAVASGLPVYILDLNRPLLDRMVAAPHTIDPDALAEAGAHKAPIWKIVAGKEQIGTGPNRMELYPIRGASTERQYMVYFPEHHLLYASDTLVLNDDGSLYDPELMFEVAQAVKREHLNVKTVFAMHQTPMEWEKVVALIEKARSVEANMKAPTVELR